MSSLKNRVKDALERIGWTAAQVAVGFAIVEVANIETAWAAIIIPALTALKTYIADKVTGTGALPLSKSALTRKDA